MAAVKRLGLFLCCFQLCLHEAICLTNVTMFVNPPAVVEGDSVILGCYYDLEKDPLYSVKWYRGTSEIYRYSPRDNPSQKTFTYRDVNIDLTYSNATQVMLRKVTLPLGGNITCEVTTDRQFKTATAYEVLEVVSIPHQLPVIKVNKDRYLPGERLFGNCSYESSKPPAKLRFLVNNRPVTTVYQIPESVNTVSFDVDPLTPGDFLDDKAGVLEVKCTAHIGRFFKKESTLKIGPKNGDPVPERVRSIGNARGAASSPHGYLLVLALLLLIPRRPT